MTPVPLTRYRAYGAPVEITGPAAIVERLAAALPPVDPGFPRGEAGGASRAPSRPPRPLEIREEGGVLRLRIGTRTLEATFTPDEVVARVVHDVQLWVSGFSVHAVLVHAGAVAWGGRALLLPGASEAGKTTLVGELLRRGATYYSDDFAVLDPRGRVWPHPRPLSVRRADGGRDEQDARELGAPVGSGGANVAWILFTTHREGARLAPDPVSRAEAVLGLLANAPGSRLVPRQVLGAASRAAAGATAWSGLRGDAAQAADWLQEHALDAS